MSERLAANAPILCVLDIVGDILDALQRSGRAQRHPSWVCGETGLYLVREGDTEYGVIAGVTGSAAVAHIAEELFATGCGYVMSLAPAVPASLVPPPGRLVLIDSAAVGGAPTEQDQAASGSDWSRADPKVIGSARRILASAGLPVACGSSITTNAPLEVTAASITERQPDGMVLVDAHAAALYAMAKSPSRPVLCVGRVIGSAHGIGGGPWPDEATDTADALRLITALVDRIDPFGGPCRQCGLCGTRDTGACIREQLRPLLR
jgi:hypothetical protein